MRLALALLSVLLTAVLPASVSFCIGDEAHLEFAFPSSDCCPGDSGDCADCVDRAAPELATARAGASSAPPPLRIDAGIPASTAVGPAPRVPLGRGLTPPASSVLLI